MSVVAGIGVALGVWLAASIPFGICAGRVLRQISDDYPPLDGDDVG